MNLLQKLKQQTLVQKVGGLLILISGLLVIIKISGIIPDFDLVEDKWSFHDNWPFIFLIGAFLYCSPKIIRNLKRFFGTPLVVIGTLFLITPTVSAQNYEKQVEAFKQSFAERSIDPVTTFISPKLVFYTYPAGATQQILSQVFSNLPKLNSLKIISSNMGEAHVRYNFTMLGERNSSIQFDGQGQITKIELIDNLLEEQAKAQAALADQVQQPNPGDLAKKFSPEKIDFSSSDGLTITGNLYEIDPVAPVILLSHSGGSNKYEYADIAPKLNAKGFNALAIDQRSGGTFAGQENETFKRAESEGIGTAFADAQQDIDAAIDYLADKYNKQVTLWGSSYSAALSLFIVQQNHNLNGLILFSPGDYLAEVKGSLKGELTSIDIPFLMTSTQDEAEEITNVLLHEVELSESQTQYTPSFEGYHGVRALWEGQEGSTEYWKEVWKILSVIYPAEK
jgi:dienelactone hydrolase